MIICISITYMECACVREIVCVCVCLCVRESVCVCAYVRESVYAYESVCERGSV